jgi:hypothetical protein
VVSTGPLVASRRRLGHLEVRVLPLAKMLETKTSPRADGSGGEKDQADLEALRALTDPGTTL